jgi:hypothetical protein
VRSRLGQAIGRAGQHSPGSHLCVDWVALAQSAASGPVRTDDLDDCAAVTGEEPGETCAVGPGPFDTEGRDMSQPGSPLVKVRVAGPCGWQPVFTEAHAEPVNGHGHMLVLVCVDSYYHPNGIDLYDVVHSCLLVSRAG